jgi:hypothetical protein
LKNHSGGGGWGLELSPYWMKIEGSRVRAAPIVNEGLRSRLREKAWDARVGVRWDVDVHVLTLARGDDGTMMMLRWICHAAHG